jgi:hypothetical protein
MTSTLRGRQPSLNDVPDDREVNSVIRVTEAMSRFADALEASFHRVAPQSVLGQ